MTDKLQRKKDEVNALLPTGVNVDFDQVFFDVDKWRSGAKKRAQRLQRVGDVLRQFLDDDEQVLGVTHGVTAHTWEMFFIGWMAYMVNGTTVVRTQKRLLFVHTDGAGNPFSYVNQVPLSAVKKASSGWLSGSLSLKLGTGRLQLVRMNKAEAKAMQAAIPVNKAAQGGREFLCPSCGTSTTEHGSPCVSCGVELKSPSTAALRSMIVPGLGDWYLGHRGTAVLEMIGGVFGWFLLGTSAVAWLTGQAGVEAVVVWLVLVLIGHSIDAAVTYAQGKKGMYSLDGQLPTERKQLSAPKLSGGGTHTPTATR